jgi:type I restriction enzyme, S subunit
VYVNEEILESSGKVIELQEGDIIVVRSGAYTGDSALVTSEWVGSIAGFDRVLRLENNTAPAFVAQAFLSAYVLESQLKPLRLRAAQPHLNAEELGSVILALPSIDEQLEISARIYQEVAEMELLEKSIQTTIDLLKEWRSVLITAAVTGQLGEVLA